MRKFPIGYLAMLAAIPAASFAQQSILGRNLIVNGGADAGPAGTGVTSVVANIPGWTITGKANVLPYDLPGLLLSTEPSAPDHSFQYFMMQDSPSVLSQNIDVSSGASTISGGNVKFTASAYLGGVAPNGNEGMAKMAVAFKNASGQTFSTTTLGPLVENPAPAALLRQQQIGLVPPGTVQITVTLTLSHSAFGVAYGAADSLSLVLDTLGTSPAAVLGPNVVSNPGADEGPGVPAPATALYIPGWSTNGASVAPYGGTGWIGSSDPGPSDRGVNVFGGKNGDMYQDIDVSPAASQIDSGKVTYQVSAWLGALNGAQTPILTYTFFDWSGKQLAATAQLGPAMHNGTSLVVTSHFDALPPGTRRVHLDVSFPAGNALADNISFTLSPSGAPVISPSGVVPVFSSSTTIAPGSWISIYGTNLAGATSLWNGDFPTSLGGVNVTVNSKPAYLWLVSPTQINLQAPDDTATGSVNVVETNQNGSATSTVTLGPYGPSFNLFPGNKYAASLVPLAVGSVGNSGFEYDYIGAPGALPFPSRPVKPGETLELFGVGFGPTNPAVPAGAAFTKSAPSVSVPAITIGGLPATVTYAGIVQAGLFQFNVVVPNAGSGDKLLQASVGGLMTPGNVFIALQ